MSVVTAKTINEFAEDHRADVGAVMLAVIKYLVEDPRDISAATRQALLGASDEDVEDALETIDDDLRSGARSVI
jgi:hypothetical protein